MNSIQKNHKGPLRAEGVIQMPAMMVPGFRTTWAIDNGVEKNLLFKTWGGLGDVVCAEPTLRFAFDNFKNCKFSLATEYPELFSHLPFETVFNLKQKPEINETEYMVFNTIYDQSHLQWEFMIHMHVHCVDYTSLCVFRGTLPNSKKSIVLKPSESDFSKTEIYAGEIAIHAGKHWQSKTFPLWWWDRVIGHIVKAGKKPILIGGRGPDGSGTVNVNADKCIDLRNKLSIMESTALLQTCSVLLTNDSAPLHLAASGDAWIGFIATCKHPDFITHWRNGQFGHKMQNLGLGGVWDSIDLCPNKKEARHVDHVGPELLKWLPEPEEFAQWALDKSR